MGLSTLTLRTLRPQVFTTTLTTLCSIRRISSTTTPTNRLLDPVIPRDLDFNRVS